MLPAVLSFILKGEVELKEVALSPYMKTIEELQSQEVLWLDARTEKKFILKHIPKAIMVGSHDWEGSLWRLSLAFETINPQITMVVYCSAGCPSSQSVARRLRKELGKENVYFLKGGMPAWFAAQ